MPTHQAHGHMHMCLEGLAGLRMAHIRDEYIFSHAVLRTGEPDLGLKYSAGLQELIALLGRIVHYAWKMDRRTSGEVADVCLVQTRVKMH
jgi:hypothetical protein